MRDRSRAVSDVLGFVLVFSLITASVGVVYAAGLGGLEDARDAEQLDNTMRAFEVLAENMEDIQRQAAPARGTEIKLSNAELRHGSQTQVRVLVSNVGEPNESDSNVRPIEYEAGTTTISYTSGAVIRSQPAGADMAVDPNFVFTNQGGERTAIVPVIVTHMEGQRAVAGSQTVLVRAERTLPESGIPGLPAAASDHPSVNEYDIELTIRTTEDRQEAWRRYLGRAIPWGNCHGPDDRTVRCDFTVDRLHVTEVHTSVAFE